MADITSYAASEKGLLRGVFRKFSSLFSLIGAGLVFYMEQSSRLAEFNRLSEMTDDELAKRGVSRDNIVHHVFRDRFHC